MTNRKRVKETKESYTIRASNSNGARLQKRHSASRAKPPTKRILGKYIVADPEICHGKVTFIGTRIFVSDVIEMVAEGMAWDEIIRQWHGSISKEAIAEAILVAYAAFRKYVDKPDSNSASL
ncbi:MAG: DUF433 domain-containing protein [Chloroflexi bacterium]|nr:DUF433 domain-containing protein [Chloroflexota bacterium]